MKEGLEPELAIAVEVMYPIERLTRAATHHRKTYPHTPLRLYVEALGGVIKPVLDRDCSIGISGSLPALPDRCNSSHCWTCRLQRWPVLLIRWPPNGRDRGIHHRQACAAGPERQDRAHGRPGLRRTFAAVLASRRSRSEACVPQGGPRMGSHAPAHGEGGLG